MISLDTLVNITLFGGIAIMAMSLIVWVIVKIMDWSKDD